MGYLRHPEKVPRGSPTGSSELAECFLFAIQCGEERHKQLTYCLLKTHYYLSQCMNERVSHTECDYHL